MNIQPRIRGQQVAIPVTIMRGGTSKGLFFHGRDLPAPGQDRDRLLLRLMGSPDVLQIDGLGGSRPITSKVAVIDPPTVPNADVDYTFAQVDIERAAVSWNGNCGNISSGVGPFAVDEALLEVPDTVSAATVRIHNTNTNMIMIAHVPVADGAAAVLGNCEIPGVPGTGAEIIMDWSQTLGAKTGSFLPTGRIVDEILLGDGRRIQATLCDVGNPAVWIDAASVSLGGSELSEQINGDDALRATLREIRGRAAYAMGLCQDWRQAEVESPGIPVVGMVAPPATYSTLNGAEIEASAMALRVRLMFMDRLHESLAGTASVNLAAASCVPGSVVAGAVRRDTEAELRVGHPSGVMTIRVTRGTPDAPDGTPRFTELGISRTARRLADVTAWVPRSR